MEPSRKQKLRLGLVGAGYMGKAHSFGYKVANTVFDLPRELVCEVLATSTVEGAAQKAAELGWKRSTGSWRDLLSDPEIDAVNLSVPPHLHAQMALACLEAGKHVFCEKPMCLSLEEARQMAEMAATAERTGLVTMMGFNYIKHPASQLVRQMVAQGEIGEIIQYHGTHVEDFFHDPAIAAGWKTRQSVSGRYGTLLDLGSHMLNCALGLVGPMEAVMADIHTYYKERPAPGGGGGGTERVETDDFGQILVRFANGASGTLHYSRLAAGRKMGYAYEIIGTRGSIRFDQTRMGEVLYYRSDGPQARQGYQQILLGPEHPDYRSFLLSAGHGIGYNEMMAIQAREFTQAIHTGVSPWPSFQDGLTVMEVTEAIKRSFEEKTWQTLPQ